MIATSKAHTTSSALPAPDSQRTYWPPLTYGDEPLGPVTTSNALRIADAFACARVLADSISTLPLKVYRRLLTGPVPAGDDAGPCSFSPARPRAARPST